MDIEKRYETSTTYFPNGDYSVECTANIDDLNYHGLEGYEIGYSFLPKSWYLSKYEFKDGKLIFRSEEKKCNYTYYNKHNNPLSGSSSYLTYVNGYDNSGWNHGYNISLMNKFNVHQSWGETPKVYFGTIVRYKWDQIRDEISDTYEYLTNRPGSSFEGVQYDFFIGGDRSKQQFEDFLEMLNGNKKIEFPNIKAPLSGMGYIELDDYSLADFQKGYIHINGITSEGVPYDGYLYIIEFQIGSYGLREDPTNEEWIGNSSRQNIGPLAIISDKIALGTMLIPIKGRETGGTQNKLTIGWAGSREPTISYGNYYKVSIGGEDNYFGGFDFELDIPEEIDESIFDFQSEHIFIISDNERHIIYNSGYKQASVLSPVSIDDIKRAMCLMPSFFGYVPKIKNFKPTGELTNKIEEMEEWQKPTSRGILDNNYNGIIPPEQDTSQFNKDEFIWEKLIERIKEKVSENHYGIRENDFDLMKWNLMRILNAEIDLDNQDNSDFNIFIQEYIKNCIEESDPHKAHWNESTAKLVEFYYDTFKNNEIGHGIDNTNYKISDIINADAANSFEENSEWVRPWENLIVSLTELEEQAENYKTIRANDRMERVLTNSKNLQYTSEKIENKNTYLRLIMPEYKRIAEVEDLDRNFWSIGQALAALCIYLFGDSNSIPKILDDLLDEICQLWENVFYLWAKTYQRTQEIKRLDYQTLFLPVKCYKDEYNNFFDDFICKEIVNILKTEHEGKERNQILLEFLVNSKYFDSYKDKYNESVIMIIPEIRDINYGWNYYARAVYPGVIIYDKNNKDENKRIIVKPFSETIIADAKHQYIIPNGAQRLPNLRSTELNNSHLFFNSSDNLYLSSMEVD